MKRPFALALCAFLGLSASSRFALAQSPAEPSAPEDPREHARELMRSGNERYRNGDLEAAHALYEQAFRVAKSFDVACNLGRTEMELARYRDAAEHLDYCVRFHILSSKPEMMLNEQEAREQLRAAKARVGSFWISVEPSGAEIWVDSRSVGLAPLAAPIFVEPGPHVVRATSPGLPEATTRVDAKPGFEQTVKLELSTARPGLGAGFGGSAPAPLSAEQSEHKRSSWGVLPWLSGGLAVVGVGVGAGFLVVAANKDSDKRDILSTLPESRPCAENTPHVDQCARVRDLAGQARTAQAVGYTSLGVGVAAAVTTGVLLLQPKHGSQASSRRGQMARVVPSVSSDRLFVSIDARF
jgi:hypothetical protein